MKVKVLKAFKDKNNNALCKEGVILDLSENRVREINSTGYGTFLELIGETEEKEDNKITDNKAENEDDPLNEVTVIGKEDKPLNDMTVDQLKELAKTLNVELNSKDKKEEIIVKINEFQQAKKQPSEDE